MTQVKEGKASIKESEFNLLSISEKRTVMFQESLMMDLKETEPDYKEEMFDEKNIILDEEGLDEVIKDYARRIPVEIKEDKDEKKEMEACRALPDDSKYEHLREEKVAIERLSSPKEKIELDKESSGNIRQNEELEQQKLEDIDPIPQQGMDEDIVLLDLEDEATQDAGYIEEHGMGEAIVSSQLEDEYPQDLSAEPQNSIDEVIKPQPLEDKEQDLCSVQEDPIHNPAQDSGSLRQAHLSNPMIPLSFFESVSRTVAQSQSQSQYIVYMPPPTKRRRRM